MGSTSEGQGRRFARGEKGREEKRVGSYAVAFFCSSSLGLNVCSAEERAKTPTLGVSQTAPAACQPPPRQGVCRDPIRHPPARPTLLRPRPARPVPAHPQRPAGHGPRPAPGPLPPLPADPRRRRPGRPRRRLHHLPPAPQRPVAHPRLVRLPLRRRPPARPRVGAAPAAAAPRPLPPLGGRRRYHLPRH